MGDSTIIWILLTALFAGCITSVQSIEPVLDGEQSGSSSAELIANRQFESGPMEPVGNAPLAVPFQSRMIAAELPIDVLGDVFSHLSIEALIAARISCRTFNSLISADPFLVDHSILRGDRLSVISQIPDVMSRMAAYYRRYDTVPAVHLQKEHTYRAITQLFTEDVIVGDAAQALPDENRIVSLHCSIIQLMNMSDFITTLLPDHGHVVIGELIMRQMIREIILSNGIVGPTAETFAHLPRSTKVAVISSVEESITRCAELITSNDLSFPFHILTFLKSYVDGTSIPDLSLLRSGVKKMMSCAMNRDQPQPQLVRLVAQLGGSRLVQPQPQLIRLVALLRGSLLDIWSSLDAACKTGSPDVVQALLEATEAPQQLIWTPIFMGKSILYSLGWSDIPEDSKVAIAEIILTFSKKPRDLILAVTIESIWANSGSPDVDHFVYQTWPLQDMTPLHKAISGRQPRLLEFYLTKLHQLDPDILIRDGLFENLFEVAGRHARSGAIGVLEKFGQILL